MAIYDRESIRYRTRRYREVLDEHWFAYLLLAPSLLGIVLFLWLPFFRGIWISFHEYPLTGDPTWIGLDNYVYLLEWDVFWLSLRATILFASATVIQLVVALVATLIVANLKKFTNAISSVFLVPYTLPPVVSGTVWLYQIDPSVGPLFKYLIDWGVLSEPIYWNVQGESALAVITLVTAWTFWPFMFLILLASREKIPEVYYESADVYGANRIQMFWRITLPQLKSAILVVVSIRLIWNLAKISQPLQLTGGGPGYETSILAILLYRFAFKQNALGLSYAVGMVLLVISLGFILVFIREYERSREVTR